MLETWYILEGGGVADPAEVSTDEAGRLVHSSGELVAMRGPGVPLSRSVDAEAERHKTRDLTADKPKRGYKTRESKAG
jgi:hypothetical protein